MKKVVKVRKFNYKRIVILTFTFLLFNFGLSAYFKSYSEFVTNVQRHNSGIVNNIVYVNDAESDYYYYMSENYLKTYNNQTPTIDNKNVYNRNSFVELTITYSGKDINDPSKIGYVSTTEAQDTFVYYKVLPINNNGTQDKLDDYVQLELIDNPFANRPNNNGFNGWVTNYKNVEISLDREYYVRYAKIPVTYNGEEIKPIEILFNASWIDSKVERLSSNHNSFSNAITSLDDANLNQYGGRVPIYEDISNYYTYHEATSGYVPDGGVNAYGNSNEGTRCSRWRPCTYYLKAREEYDDNTTYYELRNGYMQEHEVAITGYNENYIIPIGSSIAGFYKEINLNQGESGSNLYDISGNKVGNTTCYNATGCKYYEFQQYFDKDGNINVAKEKENIYYLGTRDTNIVILDVNMTSVWESDDNKPFTLTGIDNGTRHNNYLQIPSGNLFAYADTRIEHIELRTTISRSSDDPTVQGGIFVGSNKRFLFANYHNLKIGRGITQNGNYVNATAVTGTSSSTTSQGYNYNPKKYRLIVESGLYNNISTTTHTIGSSGSRPTYYLKSELTVGNDYDRVASNNENLEVYENLNGTFGGIIREDTSKNYIAKTTVKSGKIGTSEDSYTTGIYVGGRGYSSDKIYGKMYLKVEGGSIYNINGGPLIDTSYENENVVYLYMTGGTVESIFGGAGDAATYGNRVISVTGGTVNYSVFGGSNGYQSDEGKGTLNGDTFIYIGGTATIGNESNVSNNSTHFGSESGSVFGIGNGKTGSSTIGSCDNSNIVINDNAKILKNVYGGGNYGATGIMLSGGTSKSNIKVVNGTINGSIYGGGNNNGSGSSSINSTINITVENGKLTNIYGGSRTLGTVYGDVNVNILNGNIKNVYGGGEGGYTNATSKGTFVSGNINVIIGNNSVGPTISKVYGGSAFGTVNGTENTTSVQSKKTNVTINNGTITDSVFGGGEGNDTFTPYVEGDVTVTVNNGTVANVYGGNDKKGTPNGIITVYIKNGKVENTFGGGNLAPINTSTVYLQGGTSTNVYGGGNLADATTTNVYLQGGTANTIYGGSNQSGTVTTSNITTNYGTVDTVYGGNNQGGITTTSNVNIEGGNINYVYGGGNLAETGTTNVNLQGSNLKAAYGGGNEAGVTTSTNVNLKGSNVTDIFGGSNKSGTVQKSNIITNYGTSTTVYGGNNQGGETKESQLEINGGNITTVYGGGNLAETGITTVNLNSCNAPTVYGGGNEAGVTTSTNVNLKGNYITTIYGGSNKSGTVKEANIKTTNGTVNTIYGGNNQGGKTEKTQIDINGGYVTTIYGGGNVAETGTTNVNLNSTSNITTVYGGGNEAGVTDSTNVNLNGNNVTTIYGGSNKSGEVKTSNIITTTGTTRTIYGGNNQGGITETSNVTINSGTITDIYGGGNVADTKTSNVLINNATGAISNVFGGGNEASVDNSNITIKNGVNITNVFGGSNNSGVVLNSQINIPFSSTSPSIKNLYGGNNRGGKTVSANIDINCGNIEHLYGGGNYATTSETNTKVKGATILYDVYGGGNQASVEKASTLNLVNTKVTGNVFGGGNLGTVGTDTKVHVTDSTISKSLFAGGNGTTAVVYGNTLLNVDGTTKVEKHVFGGGNAAATGKEETNNSTSTVNIAGLTCGGNVYGGANTSVLYGVTNVNIGKNIVSQALEPGEIKISGTVFGGGEANASGSEIYDFSFISVTTGINIKIDASNHSLFEIDGSIFGSGNASSTTGYSNIYIKDYGTESGYKKNVSIQRASSVVLDNSTIELSGTTDRTNEYSDVIFSLSRIDELKLTNNSTLYLENGTNLVKKFTSALVKNNTETKETISIDDSGNVTRNVDNKLYVYAGKNVNIATNESVTSYGEVNGMAFFGMYNHDREGKIETGYFKSTYNNNSTVPMNEIIYFDTGSYVLGLHKTNHNYEEDGFYSNFPSDEQTDKINVKVIVPTPDDANYYMWVVGEQVTSYDITLTASKYSTLGTYELPLNAFYTANTKFAVLGFNYNELDSKFELVNRKDVPRVAKTEEEADNKMSLVMKSGEKGWITIGETAFLTSEDFFSGDTNYLTDNSSTVPSLLFYLYHSKNLSSDGDMGTATISLVAITPIDDLNNKVQRININVSILRKLYGTDDYEGTISSGKKYEMFAPSNVNITSTSAFTTYYSLFVQSDKTIYKTGYHRVLSSSYIFPKGTKITMIDLISGTTPEYYYYVITEDDYHKKGDEFNSTGEVTYELSKFLKMGSSNKNNHYDDVAKNSLYYDSSTGIAEEEFIFIVDFKEAGIEEDVLEKTLLLELRSKDNEIIHSVIGVQQQQLFYNLYANKDSVIEVDGSLSTSDVYIGEKVKLQVNTNFVEQQINNNPIIDTNYFDYRSGIKISILDSNNEVVNGPSIMGISYTIGDMTYYPRFDGTVRINVAERIANISTNITINTNGSNLASGNYKLLIESFGSPDGIYYGLTSSDQKEIPFTVKNTLYGLKVSAQEEQLIVKKETGITEQGANAITFNLQYSSVLLNPNIRISLYRRDYNDVYTDIYHLVNIKDYVTNEFETTNEENIYKLFATPEETMSTVLYLKENLKSGTYKVVFSLYDNDTYIGDVHKFIIIK